jgi:hypothetical protein
MNRTPRRETRCRQAIRKLITSLHSKRYRPSKMLIHRQNSYAPSGKQRTGRREAQSREPANKLKKTLCRKNIEENGRALICGIIPAFVWRDCGRPKTPLSE